MTFPHHMRLWAISLLIPLLFGCWEERRQPSGIVAEVNGKGISFAELEAVRNSMYMGPSSLRDIPGDVELQRQYTRALRQIILQELAAQELERLDKRRDPADLDRLEAELRRDYPSDAYEAMLEEQGLNAETVRLLLGRRLDMEQYVTKVLRPEIGLTAEEVQAYYEAHKHDFITPEQWHYLQIIAQTKAEAEAAGKSLAGGAPAADVQKNFSGTLREVRMAKNDLPEDVRAALEKAVVHTPGPAVLREGGYRVLILQGKTPESLQDAGTIAARVEAVLMEEKIPAALESTLEKRLAKSTIRIAEPLLRKAMEGTGGEEQAPPPQQGDSAAGALPASSDSVDKSTETD